ncbi:CLUMA_CG002902, isoform A [Clunio marinus]|uniref:CLUMA_CG002902, isoform A n=1 Tax=Clunio marinus TaxID=568069 RepID=A0A1J1HM73_9DIPT|nr:CLUMA_CG002902, isoform A [Clunio marinus]
MNFNKNVTNISYTLQNDGVHATLVYVSFDNFYEVVKARIRCSINFPENDRDREYKRQYFKTSVDFERLLKGVFGNSLIEKVARQIFETKNLSMPLKQGRYYLNDLSFPDITLPYGLPSRACMKGVLEAKIKGQKKSVLGSSWEFFINRV